MAGGEKLKGPFSYKVAKKVLSGPDLERLACAFLATENVYQFDHTKAATEFGGSKPDSFKRQIWVITKKIKEAMDKEEEGKEGGRDGSEVRSGDGMGPPVGKSKVKGKTAMSGGGGGVTKRKADKADEADGRAKKQKQNLKRDMGGKGKAKKARAEGQSEEGEENGHGAELLAVKAEKSAEEGEESGDEWLG